MDGNITPAAKKYLKKNGIAAARSIGNLNLKGAKKLVALMKKK